MTDGSKLEMPFPISFLKAIALTFCYWPMDDAWDLSSPRYLRPQFLFVYGYLCSSLLITAPLPTSSAVVERAGAVQEHCECCSSFLQRRGSGMQESLGVH